MFRRVCTDSGPLQRAEFFAAPRKLPGDRPDNVNRLARPKTHGILATGMPRSAVTDTIPEPTTADLDAVVETLKASWTARVTVRRQSQEDIGIRQIFVSLDDERIAILEAGQEVSREVAPGPHRLRVHNTLIWKTIDFTVAVGEHASFVAINRAGFGTYSILAFLIGGNLIYLTVEREEFYGQRQ